MFFPKIFKHETLIDCDCEICESSRSKKLCIGSEIRSNVETIYSAVTSNEHLKAKLCMHYGKEYLNKPRDTSC